MKKLISIYHINTNFSSINPSQFKNLINNSYNKLLDLVEYNDYNINIEASAKSLIELRPPLTAGNILVLLLGSAQHL